MNFWEFAAENVFMGLFFSLLMFVGWIAVLELAKQIALTIMGGLYHMKVGKAINVTESDLTELLHGNKKTNKS